MLKIWTCQWSSNILFNFATNVNAKPAKIHFYKSLSTTTKTFLTPNINSEKMHKYRQAIKLRTRERSLQERNLYKREQTLSNTCKLNIKQLVKNLTADEEQQYLLNSTSGLPRLIYLQNPIKWIQNKFYMRLLRLAWDRDFIEKEFKRGAKQVCWKICDGRLCI